MIALWSVLRIVPGWCYGALAFVVLAGAGAVYEREQGRNDIRKEWHAADLKRAQADADAAAKNADNNRLIAQAQAATNQRVSQQYETAIAQAAEQNTILRAAVARSGGLRLPTSSNSAAVPAVAASAGGIDAASGSKLPDQLTELLLSEAERADQIAAQLAAIQAWAKANGFATKQ